MLLVFPSFSTSSGFAFAAEREFFHPFSRSGFGIRRSPFSVVGLFFVSRWNLRHQVPAGLFHLAVAGVLLR
jgi:hypothetical protein